MEVTSNEFVVFFLALYFWIQTIKAACPDGFLQGPDTLPYAPMCYGYIQQPRDFYAAEMDCRSRGEGGTLVQITDKNTKLFVKDVVLAPLADAIAAKLQVWIGTNDIRTNMEYRFNDGRPRNYTNVGISARGHGDVAEDGCLRFKANFGYQQFDAFCSEEYVYVCQLPLVTGPELSLSMLLVNGPDATSDKWQVISTHSVLSQLECSDLCISQPPCAAILMDSTGSTMKCSILKADGNATLTVPPGAKLYEWVVGGEF